MADNSVQNGTDTISTDDIGGSVKVQRVKVQYGADGSATDVAAATPLPVTIPQGTATGNITTQNLVPAGVATAASAVEVTVDESASVAIQITGTYTGALSLQATVDGTNWVTLGGTPLVNINTGVSSATIVSAAVGIFQADVAGFLKVRITALAAVTGTATATLIASVGTGVVALDAALPTGANVIGALSANQTVVLTAGAAIAGKVGIDQTTDGTTNKVSGGTLTKGTQNANGFSTQDLHNSGRNLTNYFMAAPIITTVAEVMMSLTGYKSGAVVGATATPAVVTAGKTYRIERVIITYVAATAIGSMRVNLRALSSGVALIGSPLVMSWQVGIPAVFTAGSAETYVFDYPEGLEFAAGFGIAVSIQGFGAVPTTGTIVGYGMIAIEGYEY